MISISVEMGGAIEMLAEVSPAAARAKITAFNKTVSAILPKEKAQIPIDFHKPVAWTVNSLQKETATLAAPNARVWFKNLRQPRGTPAGIYLVPHIVGGDREKTRWEQRLISAGIMKENEWAIPTRSAPFNANGNLPSSLFTIMYNQIIMGDTSTRTASGRRRRGLARFSYFAMGGDYRPTGRGLARGIYQNNPGFPNMIMMFTTRKPTYRPIMKFHEVAQDVTDEVLFAAWHEAMDIELPPNI